MGTARSLRVPPRVHRECGVGDGNFLRPGGDYLDMTCDEIRVALSARMDGEEPQVPVAHVDAHLRDCADCRAWRAQAEAITRAVRVQPADVPDLTEKVLAAVAAEVGDAARRQQAAAAQRSRRQILRIAVAGAAIAQLLLAVPILVTELSVLDPHTSREMASFDAALAVGFLLAAYRPERAQAFVPVGFVLSVCLALTSVVDIVNSDATVMQELGHLVTVAQAVLLWALGRVDQRVTGPLSAAVARGRG